jgi:hypothetical protein
MAIRTDLRGGSRVTGFPTASIIARKYMAWRVDAGRLERIPALAKSVAMRFTASPSNLSVRPVFILFFHPRRRPIKLLTSEPIGYNFDALKFDGVVKNPIYGVVALIFN